MLATIEELKAYDPSLASATDAALMGALSAVSENVAGAVGPLLSSDFPAVLKVRTSDWAAGRFIIGTRYASAVTHVNGAAYTGALGSDYFIDGEEVTMPGFAPVSYAPFFTVTVTGGIASVPKDLKLAVMALASAELSREGGKAVASQALGPRSVTFAQADVEPAATLDASRVIRSYIPARP